MKPLFQSEAKCEAIDMKMIFYKVFSHEVTAAILVSQNNEMGGHFGVPNQSPGS